MNVERFRYEENRKDVVSQIDTLPISIEPSELVTVQRMGAGLPVLLVRADLDQQKCYFVCLNDYIDKILLPQHGKDALSHSRTIHIPALNDLADMTIGHTAIRWYGKRPKLYAAFQKFIYQQAELAWSSENEQEHRRLANHCAGILLGYDFWDNTPMWEILAYYSAALRRFVENGSTGLTQINMGEVDRYAQGDSGASELSLVGWRFRR